MVLRASLGLAVVLAFLLVATFAFGQQPKRPYELTEEREPCDSYDPLRQPLFGDTHVHTAYSFDASTQDTRNTPYDAYRFAKGEALGIQPYDESGKALRTIQLERPIDFTAVTDHAELLGEVNLCLTPGSSAYSSIVCWIHRNWPQVAFQLIAARTLVLKGRWGICGDENADCLEASGNVWHSIQDAAEKAYDRSSRCSFTSFVAYEWTATVGTGMNLHRNVIFRNDKVPPLPISWVDTPSAADLWRQLDEKCLKGMPGCDVLTIPHNSNLSGGLMFETASLASPEDAGAPVSAEDARLRDRWEPLVEVMQHKGDSECFWEMGSADEHCRDESLPYDRFGAKFSMWVSREDAGPSSYVRSALKKGLLQQSEIGANSLKFGLIAATDTHIAAPGLTAEKDHPGHGGAGLAADDVSAAGFPDDIEFNPGGLAVVWAEENTRDSIFAAMMRKEVYGTSGTRPVVRFFGGWSYPKRMCLRTEFAQRGYAWGVPMGSDLPPRPEGAPSAGPRFAFSALQDPGVDGAAGTPLQRLQIIKGWVKDGATHERVIDVAGGANAATVDLATCEPQGRGASSLCTVWEDPDFDPTVPAFYYGRVLENPTCRWSRYVCNAAKVNCAEPSSVPEGLTACCDPEQLATIQERAWTSPIWYTPQ